MAQIVPHKSVVCTRIWKLTFVIKKVLCNDLKKKVGHIDSGNKDTS